MVSQIFKTDFKDEILWELLNSISDKKNKYYLITKENFKRGSIFSNSINDL